MQLTGGNWMYGQMISTKSVIFLSLYITNAAGAYCWSVLHVWLEQYRSRQDILQLMLTELTA